MAEDSSVLTSSQFCDCRKKRESFSWRLYMKTREKLRLGDKPIPGPLPVITGMIFYISQVWSQRDSVWPAGSWHVVPKLCHFFQVA